MERAGRSDEFAICVTVAYKIAIHKFSQTQFLCWLCCILAVDESLRAAIQWSASIPGLDIPVPEILRFREACRFPIQHSMRVIQMGEVLFAVRFNWT